MLVVCCVLFVVCWLSCGVCLEFVDKCCSFVFLVARCRLSVGICCCGFLVDVVWRPLCGVCCWLWLVD